jgi:FkbM family methyltransferase
MRAAYSQESRNCPHQLSEPVRIMDNRLIFDIGMHAAEDTSYYLKKGFRVVAVDADFRLIERAHKEHAEAVLDGRLILLHCAVAAEEGSIAFHLSNHTIWNSLKKEISDRNGLHQETVTVPCRRLVTLMQEYGVPFYCKIDVEGYDAVCLATLEGSSKLPQFISVETECIAEDHRLDDEGVLQTLDLLRKLGYSRFKLVDQRSLAILSPSGPDVYRARPPLWERVFKRIKLRDYGFYNGAQFVRENRQRLSRLHNNDFPFGATGPFGDDLEGNWIDYGMARKTLLRHRQNYFRIPREQNYSFWCDWHAAR